VSAVIGGLIAAAFVFVGVNGMEDGGSDEVTLREVDPGRPVEVNEDSSASVREVYKRDGPGVVSVDVASSELGPAGGSGFVLDEKGYIVTNQHVVDGAEAVSVRFANGAREEAEVVGEDPSTDVAVLKVDAPGALLKPLVLGDSDNVGVGDPVIAIGNPLNVGLSVTTGIISGTGRPIEAPNGYTIDGAVQTDAAISSGNSGGPLLDERGTVIGINSQVAASGPQSVAQGIGFAVPINTVKDVVGQLISTGEAEHGYIGVRMFEVGIEELRAYTGLSEDDLSERYDLPASGAIVSEAVEDGPAYRAGIRGGEEEEIEGLPVPVGDVITAVEGQEISGPDDLIVEINSRKPGDTLSMTVVTPGEEPREVEVTLGDQPEEGA
jgi:S1-C subfamily serine protease